MPDPPHGPPEITEAQQAATAIEAVGSPTPDNVSRAVQNYSPGAVAAAAASIGARGGGGSQTLAEVLAEGADPDGNPITGEVEITLAESGTPLAIFAPGQAATLITGSGDSRLVWTAVDDGTGGNSIHVEAVNTGDPNQSLSVFLNSARSIGVSYATDGASVVTSTAAQVRAAVNAHGGAGALVVVTLAGGSNGSGLMVDEIHDLAGGIDGTDQDTFEPRLTTLPIADVAGVRVDTTTWQDQIGDGNTMAVLVFPQDTTAFAIAIEGDEFPRYIFGADPENNGITMGDGTGDATGGPGMYYNGGDLALNQYQPSVSLQDVLVNGTSAGANPITNLLDPSSSQDAATKKYVDDFPVVIPNGAVTTAKIADANVTDSKLAEPSVTAAKMNANAVTATAIAAGAVTAFKTNLPTSNPGPGLVWNDGGVWKVGT